MGAAADITNASNEYQNTNFITLASVVSALSVVILHSNGIYWTFSSTERYWKTANVIDAVFYFAVPVFFMISASTLLNYNKRYGLGTYFKKRIVKTFIPYVFWSLFGLAFQIYYLESIDGGEVTLSYILNGLGNGSLVSKYWFFPALFSVYLSIPLFAAVEEKRRKEVFTYLSVAGFLICSLWPLLRNVLDISASTSVTIGVASGYLFYIATGYLLSHYEVRPWLRKLLYIFGIIGLLIHIVGTYQVSMAAGSVVRTYKGYTNVPSIMYSVAVFLFFCQHGNRIMEIDWVSKITKFLSKYTFSLYLLHWYILEIMIKVFSIDKRWIIYRLFAVIPTTLVVVGITFAVRKIPLLKKLLP